MTHKIVNISGLSRQAKYRQIINSILDSIACGRLRRGDKVPSINEISKEFKLSRDTVMLAFNELKARGVIVSSPGIGYFIESTNVLLEQKIFLLFDEFNSFKENLYNSFVETLGSKVHVDIFFHHFNKRVFETLIKDNVSRYTTFVILPGNLLNIKDVLSVLPQDRVFILDQVPPELKGMYPSVYQDFEDEIVKCLELGVDLLRKYQHFIFVYPGGKEPIGFLDGFRAFCQKHQLNYEVIANLKNRKVKKGDVYILPNDVDLVTIIKEVHSKNMVLGSDVGIISINDMPLKEVVANGITTISTDFYEMGRTLARLVKENKKDEIKNPSRLIIRNSL